MKNFIVIMIFAVGIFVLMPSIVSCNTSPPDQVCIVQDVGIPVLQDYEFNALFVSCGQIIAEAATRVNSLHRLFYLEKDRTRMTDLGVRCQSKISAKNKVPVDQVRIRNDTSVIS